MINAITRFIRPSFSTRRYTIILTIVAVAALCIADTINTFLAQSLTQPDAVALAAPAAPPAPAPARDFSQLAQEIVHSGLFPASPSAERDASSGPGGVSLPPIDAAKKIKLMGTVMGDGLSGLAVIQNVSTQRQILYHLHEHIPDVGEVSEIHANSILVRQGERQELLELAGLKMPPPSPRPSQLPPLPQPLESPPAPEAPRAAAARPQKNVLDRREVVRGTADLGRLQSQVRLEPVRTNGKLTGFQVATWQTDSLWHTLGFNGGDVIQQVNDTVITDPGTLYQALRQLKDEQSFQLNILRKGQPTTLTYQIQ